MPWGFGYTITDVLNMWAANGVFAYALPFLLIFAMVFGILSKTKILGDNKGVQATISLAVGLLSLQFDYVTEFYATIFPYAAIGISILLVALILLGVTANDIAWTKYVWFGIAAIIFLVVIFTSLSDYTWMGGMGYGFYEAWPAILAGVILLLLIGWVVFSK